MTVNKGIYFSIKFKNLFSSVICLMAIASYLLLILSFYIGVDSNEAASNVSVISALPLIIIDPGHGGEDGGTSSADGIIEKDINLSISRKLDILLTLCGYNTLMTRNEDKLIYSDSHESMRSKKVSDIRNRMSVIENNPESVFLSIHQNYFTQQKYNGAQVFYSPNNPESKLIADYIQKSVRESLQTGNERKTKKSGKEIYLLYHSKTPSVMVECGFMSNPTEAALLNDEEYQIKMSLVILNGLNEYFIAKGDL